MDTTALQSIEKCLSAIKLDHQSANQIIQQNHSMLQTNRHRLYPFDHVVVDKQADPKTTEKTFEAATKHFAQQLLATEEKTAFLKAQYKAKRKAWLAQIRQKEESIRKDSEVRCSIIDTAIQENSTVLPEMQQTRSRRQTTFAFRDDTVRTEEELKQVIDRLYPASQPIYLKTLTVCPDMTSSQPFVNHNRRKSPVFYESIIAREMAVMASWTEAERKAFVAAYLKWPKVFGKISEAMPRDSSGKPTRSIQDCVLFYYLNKKALNLKKWWQKGGQEVGRRGRRRREEETSDTEVEVDEMQATKKAFSNYWTRDEKRAFDLLLQKYGKDSWEEIAGELGTKSALQVKRFWMRRMFEEEEAAPTMPILSSLFGNGGGIGEIGNQ